MELAPSNLADVEKMLKANPTHTLLSMEAKLVAGALRTGVDPQSEAAGGEGGGEDARRRAARVVLAACTLGDSSNRDRLGRTETFEGLVRCPVRDSRKWGGVFARFTPQGV